MAAKRIEIQKIEDERGIKEGIREKAERGIRKGGMDDVFSV